MHAARAALAVVVVAACPVVVAAPCAGFTDVQDTSPFCVNVEWMKSRNITLGCTSATLYCPDNLVTRLQMAAFMYRLGFQNAFLQGGNAFGAAAVVGTTDDQPIDVHANGKRVARYEPTATSPNVIVGSAVNHVTAGVRGATIAGGGSVGPDPSFGGPNRVTDVYGVIGGGSDNQAGNDDSDVANSSHATVAGGLANIAWDKWSTVGGGAANQATGDGSTVGGGANNIASGAYSTVSGGHLNLASGVYSWAGGFAAKTQSAGSGLVSIHDGVFIWSDRSVANFHSAASNEFAVRSTGGVRIVTGITLAGIPVAGVTLTAGDSSWNVLSDRALKDNWRTVDGAEVLERVVAMPIGRWSYRAQSPAVEHIGPSAQDFHSAFGLGHDATRIATVDADGVALAAIQGLNAKVEAERAARDAEIAALRAELAAIRAVLPATQASSATQ